MNVINKSKFSQTDAWEEDNKKNRDEVLNGADIIVRCLAAENVDHVFGYPGGAILPVHDALSNQDRIKHILVRHEQSAVHAADAYSRSSSKIGVALVTSGPGATNAVTGIATAYMDSIPMVVISGQVPLHAIGQDSFQECDIIGITRSCVKHSFLVNRVEELATTIKKAFYLANTGRPGPVLIDIPKNITTDKCAYAYPENVHIRAYKPGQDVPRSQIRRAMQMMLSAQHPLIYAGGGVTLSDAAHELNQLVDRLGFPCTNTLMGLGSYKATSPRFLGMLGMHGTYEANMAMHHCDVLIAIGARFDDRVIGDAGHFAQRPRSIIHIDIDPTSISKRVKVNLPIVGNVKAVLREMLAQLDVSEPCNIASPTTSLDLWWEQIDAWRGRKCLEYQQLSNTIKPQFVVEKLWEVTKGDAFITSDVGQHQMWAAQYYKFDKSRRWINSGGLGTMGVGLPYAMGVQMANPDAMVACITGEASIQMSIKELATCKQYQLTPKIIMLNNRSLGMVRQLQDVYSGSRYSESYMDSLPDFDKLAASYGHVGITIDRSGDVECALRNAFAIKDRLVFMNFITDQTESVWPMIAAGKGLTEMLLGSEDL